MIAGDTLRVPPADPTQVSCDKKLLPAPLTAEVLSTLCNISHWIRLHFVKAALYTIVPRSPFFAFCTPKY